MPLAHETWFVEGHRDLDWSFTMEGRTLALLALAVVATLLVRAAARVRQGIDVPFLARLAPWMPFAVRMHLAVSLVGLLSAGTYLAPSMKLGNGIVDVLLGIVVAVVAVLLFCGWHTRVAALLLVLAGPFGAVVFGFGAVLQRADVLGLALFLLVTGPGRWSADVETGRVAQPTTERLGLAILPLRLTAGAALIAVGFAEKLANPELALEFTDAEGVDFNLAKAVGLPVGDLEFIRAAGAIEVLFGLLVISGALPQLIVLVAGVPFNATLYFFGTIELLGHLPIYVTMLVLLVYGSSSELRPWCPRLWPRAGAVSRASRPATTGAG